jgi:hypothetical protein
MKLFNDRSKRAFLVLLLAGTVFSTCSCAMMGARKGELPPLLGQDELMRPYQKVGAIEVTRERFGDPTDLTAADYSWAHLALREEALKIGADAVILPEVRVERDRYIIFPTSEMKAKGIAIKFH